MKVRIQSKSGNKVIDLNRRRAIREKCLNCTGWSIKEVKECEFTDCPLYQFRSGQGKQDAIAREKAIRKFCLWCCADQILEVSKCPARDCSLFVYRKTKIDRSVEIDSDRKNTAIDVSEETISVEWEIALAILTIKFFETCIG